MDKIVQVIVVATGGYTYHFGVTADQAQEVLSASVGQEIALNEPDEFLKIWSAETIVHFRQVGKRVKCEDLVRASVLRQLKELIVEARTTS